MINNCLVSVIIPCYNSSGTIERSLSSVVKQSYQYLEIIVVDDASIDFNETREIVYSFRDPRIIFLQHEVNKNGSAARNTGMSAAKGNYIALLDSDDFWFEDHIRSYIDDINKNRREGNYLYYCKCKINGVWNNYTLPFRAKLENESVSDYLFRNNGFICTDAMFFPAQLFNLVAFNEKLPRHQDYDFVLKLEEKKIPFYFSSHQGVEVFWRNNDIKKKGGGWKYSLEWGQSNKNYFTKSAFSAFILKYVVWHMLREGKRFKAARLLVRFCLSRSIAPQAWYNTLKLFVLKR